MMRINSFYVEGTKDVKVELLDKTAEEIAKSLVGVYYDRNDKPKEYGVGRTQLRRLFNEVKRFEQKLDGNVETWKKQCPYIKMIKSKACYNIVRACKDKSKENVYKELSVFITDGINLIKDEEDYRVFTALFEAVYGFYYEKSQNFERGN
jgi:CRISPR-associated protein Csm2